MAITPEQAAALEAAWTKPHEVYVRRQSEARPGPEGWLERRSTDLIHVLCNCGYSSGWIRQDQAPTWEQIKAEHSDPDPAPARGF